jgi:hypothetical protein
MPRETNNIDVSLATMLVLLFGALILLTVGLF